MQATPTPQPRKKFLGWLAAAIASVTVFRVFLGPMKKEPEPETITMLTQDGKLVVINKDQLNSGSRKISDGELQQWINK